jgi:prepilin-type processing-associated H-X9-DG protein
LGGRGEFDVWRPRHLPTGSDGDRRVARARHRDGCNGAFMDGHSDWVQAEKMTEQMWQPKRQGLLSVFEVDNHPGSNFLLKAECERISALSHRDIQNNAGHFSFVTLDCDFGTF